MMDDRFADVLQDVARDYNRPPETPREVIWAGIEAARRERAGKRRRFYVLYSPWTRWGVGIAAALLVGFGLGRLTLRDGAVDERFGGVQPSEVGEAGGREGEGVGGSVVAGRGVEAGDSEGSGSSLGRGAGAFEYAMVEHLNRAETFLTDFRFSASSGQGEMDFWVDAGELLASTRLLLGTPVAEDPVFGRLLEDLELVLIQVVQLSSERDGGEVDLVTEGLERRGLLPRLRSAVLAGPAGQTGGLL
ncbi:MAG: hypothetical protein JSU87_10270 [Gemmatimonadota bacterium]|nr:MAG: hypothetical protein JSU87_10270 [Gemmatimonadota bacterium]